MGAKMMLLIIGLVMVLTIGTLIVAVTVKFAKGDDWYECKDLFI